MQHAVGQGATSPCDHGVDMFVYNITANDSQVGVLCWHSAVPLESPCVHFRSKTSETHFNEPCHDVLVIAQAQHFLSRLHGVFRERFQAAETRLWHLAHP